MKKKQKLLVFATLVEAKTSLQYSNAKQRSVCLYETKAAYLLITGIGCIAASCCLSKHLHLSDNIINFGIAGALKPNLNMGSLYQASTISKHISLPENIDKHSQSFSQSIYPSFSSGSSKGHSIISSDYPIHNEKDRHKLAKSYDLVDMEAYGIAYACKSANKDFSIYKAVSDFANSPFSIKEQLPILSNLFASLAFEKKASASLEKDKLYTHISTEK